MNEKTKITFELESPTEIKVIREGTQIGMIWSQFDEGALPYSHDKTSYRLNSVQICGFDGISETWLCGIFPMKKDCVIHFTPENKLDKMKRKPELKLVSKFVFEELRHKYGKVSSKAEKVIDKARKFDVLALKIQEDGKFNVIEAVIINENSQDVFFKLLRKGVDYWDK